MTALRRGLPPPPVAGTTLAPALDPLDVGGSTEVVAVAALAQPTPLTGGLAGLPAGGLGTVVLAIRAARIWNEEGAAAAALTSARRAAHREPTLEPKRRKEDQRKQTGRRQDLKKEEGL